MTYTDAERQQRFRQKARNDCRVRLEPYLAEQQAGYLSYLAWYWQCSKQTALEFILEDAWNRAGQPIKGYDDDGNVLPKGASHPDGKVLEATVAPKVKVQKATVNAKTVKPVVVKRKKIAKKATK